MAGNRAVMLQIFSSFSCFSGILFLIPLNKNNNKSNDLLLFSHFSGGPVYPILRRRQFQNEFSRMDMKKVALGKGQCYKDTMADNGHLCLYRAVTV